MPNPPKVDRDRAAASGADVQVEFWRLDVKQPCGRFRPESFHATHEEAFEAGVATGALVFAVNPICPYAGAILSISDEINRILRLLPAERRGQFTEAFERAYKPLRVALLEPCHAPGAPAGARACQTQAPHLIERLRVLLTALRAYRGEDDFVFVGGHPDALELGAGDAEEEGR